MSFVFQTRSTLTAGTSLAILMFAGIPALAEDVTVSSGDARSPTQIPKVSVTDEASPTESATTEGTGSYTSPSVTVAGKEALPVKEIPNSVSVITRQEMDDRNLSTVYDAMREAPGVTALPNDGTQSQYNARGYSLGGMLDGVPMYNGFTGVQQFDLAIYDRLEILRGPSGLLEGSGQPGGEVNMVRKRARDEFAASATLSTGSWNNQRGVADLTGALTEDGALRMRVVTVAQNRDFFYDHASEVKRVGYGELEYDIDPDTTVAAAFATQSNRTTPFYGQPAYTNYQRLNVSRSFNPTAAWSKDINITNEQNVSIEHHFSRDWRVKAQLTWREQYDRYYDTEPGTGVNPTKLTTTFWGPEDYTYNYYHQIGDVYAAGPVEALGRTHKLLIGFNSDRYNYSDAGGELDDISNVPIFDPTTSVTSKPDVIPYDSGAQNQTLQYGPYGQARISVLDPLTLVAGGRITNFSNRSRGVAPGTPTAWKQGAKATGEFTPYGGAIYDVTKEISVYGSYADIFIPQTSLTYSGKPLDPRQGSQYEFGVKGGFLNDRLNTALAYYDIDDTNRSYADPNHKNYYLQEGEIDTRGIDFEIGGSPARGWNLTASYSYMICQYVKDTNYTGSTPTNWYPRHLVKTWGKYTIGDGILKGLSLGLGVDGMTRYWGNATNSALAQSAYIVANGLIGYRINDQLSATLDANNITDTKYFATTGRSLGTYNTYGDPRNFILTLRAEM